MKQKETYQNVFKHFPTVGYLGEYYPVDIGAVT